MMTLPINSQQKTFFVDKVPKEIAKRLIKEGYTPLYRHSNKIHTYYSKDKPPQRNKK